MVYIFHQDDDHNYQPGTNPWQHPGFIYPECQLLMGAFRTIPEKMGYICLEKAISAGEMV